MQCDLLASMEDDKSGGNAAGSAKREGEREREMEMEMENGAAGLTLSLSLSQDDPLALVV